MTNISNSTYIYQHTPEFILEMWTNVQGEAALLNIGGALCSTLKSLADAQQLSAVQ